MGEPLGRRDKSAGHRKHSDKTEKKLATLLAGRRQTASGSTMFAKGDVELPEFLLDSKETHAGVAKLDGAELVKINRQAREVGKTPGLVLTLHSIKALGCPKQWAVIPIDEFNLLQQRALLNDDGTPKASD